MDGKDITSKCSICTRSLDVEGDPYSFDCGGDCVMCMANIALDPDAVEHVFPYLLRDIKKARDIFMHANSNQSTLESWRTCALSMNEALRKVEP